MNARARVGALFRWTYPGLGVKRWLFVIFAGVLLLLNGVDRYFVAQGLHLGINEIVDGFVDDYFAPANLWWIFSVLGIACVVVGVRQWFRAIARASAAGGELECTVVMEPSWPVFIACSMSSASPERTSQMRIRSGRRRSAFLTRSSATT